MPITIILRHDDHASAPDDAPRLTFDAPRVVIGRGPSCDVRLPDASVSQRHATIQAKGAEYTISDEGSTNGSWVGGVRLSAKAPRVIRSGDLVRVGRVWLEVRIDQTPATADLPVATRDLALALVAHAMRSLGDPTSPTVRVVEGRDTGASLVLAEEGHVYRVGRAETCELPLADEDASREHFQVVRRGSAVLVRDLGSKNGTFLGDAPVPFGRDAIWKPSTMLRVGAHVLALDEPVSDALGDLESRADEPIAEADLPPPPSSAPDAEPARRSAPGAAAPIASVERSATTKPSAAKKKPLLTSTDAAVIALAVVVIGLSVAGLVWLLKG